MLSLIRSFFMTGSPYRPRIRTFLAWTARLIIVAYVFQIVAFDHWRDPSHLAGIEGSSRHIVHCHGDPAGCADSSSLLSTLPAVDRLRLPPSPLITITIAASEHAASVLLASPDKPPQFA
jgi:hypothetical protein